MPQYVADNHSILARPHGRKSVQERGGRNPNVTKPGAAATCGVPVWCDGGVASDGPVFLDCVFAASDCVAATDGAGINRRCYTMRVQSSPPVQPTNFNWAFRRGRPAENVVAFYNKRGTCEQWIKEGKGAIKWTRLSSRPFAANAVRLQLHALAYNLGNFLRTLATPEPVKDWSLTTLKEKLVPDVDEPWHRR